MRTTLLFVFFVCLFASSCQPDNEVIEPIELACKTENWGDLKVTSKQEEPYDLYVNDALQRRVAAREKVVITKIPAGFCKVEVKQVNYILYPTVFKTTLTVKSCTVNSVEF